MADKDRHPGDDLTPADDPVDVAGMDFFELLRRLETGGRRFGRAGTAEREPARLGQSARQTFAASDVAGLSQVGGKPHVAVNVLGLIGPEGPMPLHMTRWIIARQSNRWFSGDDSGTLADTSFLDFLNMLQHRMIALYWRSWADARPEEHIAHGDGGRVTAMIRALAGIGLPGSVTGDIRIDGAKLRHATSLAQEARSPERLTAFLETVLGVPVDLAEFVGVWIDIPDHLQTRLGQQHAGLGTGAVLGARTFNRQSRAEIRLGPLSYDQFATFIDDAKAWERLRHAVIYAVGKDIDFGLRLFLKANDVPAARLGQVRLGRTTWLNPEPGRDPDDLCFHRITDPASNRSAA
ncbi:type VI secretion system baseplate subunit TssG [Litorisediminicola beolgyonensis]|uniref:Type VI secretion system baseplate subunit TssG n=1 Tax=Litorisediminicola beolgyonensis TaxID=1173614 RepID=A0ABW3ZM22_9RHOB